MPHAVKRKTERLRSLRVSAVVAVFAALVLAGCTQAAPRLEIPEHARVLFFGDSWTNGYSAAPGRGFADVVAASLDWKAVRTPDGSGTGFVHDYPGAADTRTFAARASALPHSDVDLIVVEGGINDVGFDLTGYEGAVEATVAALHRRFGSGTPIVIVGPPATVFPASASLNEVDGLARRGAEESGAYYVSPYRQHWITARNVGFVIDPKTGHPSTAGHAYFAARLIDALERLRGR